VRRIAALFALLLFLSAAGAISLVSMLFGGRGATAPAYLSPVFVLLVSGLLLFAMLAVIVRRLGGPLGDIVEAANRVADGDYSTRIASHGPPSVRMVGNAFNTMIARLQAQDTERRALMADIAHELRTPLSVMQGRLEGLLDGIYPRDETHLAGVLEETRMLARLVEDLRTFANAESGVLNLQKESTDLSVLIRDVVNSLSTEAASHQAGVRVDVATDLAPVVMDPLRIRQVLVNLLSNALHHTPVGGGVWIAARASAGRTTVTVSDTGPGIPAEELSKVFDRFYKGAGSRGSGLGLTIARSIIAAHGGEIGAESQTGKGTTITFTLPG
jgi:signal transduction histidine kinase